MWIRSSLLSFIVGALLLLNADARVCSTSPGCIDDGIINYTPSFVLAPGGQAAGVDLNFATNLGWNSGKVSSATSLVTVSRASQGTDLLSTSASGASYNVFANNVARITPGVGLLVEESRTNFLLNSTAPVTQTTGTLANGTYTLWANGSGTATMSPGTATGCGTSAATQGNPISFTTSGTAGTCTVTVSGSLNAFQLELNSGAVSDPTSLIITGAATVTRAADVVTLASVPTFGASVTLYALGIPEAPVAFASNQTFLDVNDGTTSNAMRIYRNNANGKATFALVNGGSFTSDITGSVMAPGISEKMAATYAPGSQMAALNGVPVLPSGTAASIGFTPSTVRIGSRGGVGTLFTNGYVSRVAIWPTIAVSFLTTVGWNYPSAPDMSNMLATTPNTTVVVGGFSWITDTRNVPSSAAYAVERSLNGQGNTFRFEVRSGERAASDVSTVERSEMYSDPLDQTKIINWEYSLMIEPGSFVPGSNFCIVGQMHATEDPADISTNPPIGADYGDLAGGFLEIFARGSSEDPMVTPPPKSVSAFVPIQVGVWNHLHYRFRYDTFGAGFLQVWYDGVKVVEYSGLIGYRDVHGPHPAMGIYRGDDPNNLVVWYNDISITYE